MSQVSVEEFQALKDEVAALRGDLAEIKALLAGGSDVAPEVVYIITAAVCAYLGKKGRVRSIRPIEHGAEWQTQGRTSIMASHQLTRH